MQYIGVDISKDFFDCAYQCNGDYKHQQFPNNPKGFKQARQWNNQPSAHWVMEATGSYYESFAHFLFDANQRVSVVNPLVIKRFVQMKLYSAKTDKLDAMYIADYATQNAPKQWIKPSQEQTHIKHLNAWIKSLISEKIRHSNRLHALKHSANACVFVTKEIGKQINRLPIAKETVIIEANSQKGSVQIGLLFV